ncbi:MAG: rhodanese-like domain-containing protein [Trueperaceae bacterium]|nr:rhodanese-like domain-containing protein [Desulfuromonadales bacterium]UCH25960.1 MAG: rhodanese-like domain-containing protein [Trueperaceae bacterium]
MKRFIVLLSAFLVTSIAVAQVPTITPASDVMAQVIAEASQQGWLQISPETAMNQIDAIDPFVIDVRNQNEWDEKGYIPGAMLIPVTELATNVDALPGDVNEPIIVYCAKGTRGNYALLYLKSLGYANVKNLSGGFTAWVDAGLPVAN